MKITKDNQSILQIEEFNREIVLFAAVILIFSLAKIGYLAFQQEPNAREYIHWSIAAMIAFFGGNAFSEKITFQFIRSEKMIKSSRKKIIGRLESGQILFENITDVKLTTTEGGQRTKYRIELICNNESIPISKVYSQGKKEEYSQIINKIIKYIKT